MPSTRRLLLITTLAVVAQATTASGPNGCFGAAHLAGNLQIGYAVSLYGTSSRSQKAASPKASGQCGNSGAGTQTGWNIKWVATAGGAAGGSELANSGGLTLGEAWASDLKINTACAMYNHNRTGPGTSSSVTRAKPWTPASRPHGTRMAVGRSMSTRTRSGPSAAAAYWPAMTSHPPSGPPLLQVRDGRALITLNRPAHHNRLHVEDLLTLQHHLSTLGADASARLLVITGQGQSFCSGFHIGEFDGPAAATAGPQLFEQTVDALEAFALPTICRLNGSVFGGAIDLALACDFRIGLDTLSLRMPAARLGLHYYPSGLQRYVSRLGLATAKRLFLLAEAVSAAELLALGYLDCLAPAAQLDAEVDKIAAGLAAGAPLALRGMKASLNEIARGEFDLGALREREALCAASADLQEGKAAFAEKRPPRFSGR